MLMLTLISVAVFVSAQVALAADTGNLTGLIRGFGLPQDKTNQALTLTGKFLGQVEQSSSSLLKLLGTKAPGQQDANLNEQINLIQRDLNLKKQQFQLDLTDLVGADNANKVIEVVNGAIPAVLQPTPVTAAQPGHDPQGMASMNMPNTNNTPGTAHAGPRPVKRRWAVGPCPDRISTCKSTSKSTCQRHGRHGNGRRHEQHGRA